MDVIESIRREYGLDEELHRQAISNPQIKCTIDALRGNMHRALECLSVELYSKPTHFLLEFIQNADDNKYADGVTPELRLRIEDDQMIIQCNEMGFSAENVRAICRVGASTKKVNQGYIGEKGIGFKSVFKVADVVHISSREYSFLLDKRAELGMVTPKWDPAPTVARPGWTTFTLQLSGSEDGRAIDARLRDIELSILLFLRRLRSIVINVALNNTPPKTIALHRYDIGADLVALEETGNGQKLSQKYFLVKHETETPKNEEKRVNIGQSQIVLAFPIDPKGEPLLCTQNVHAFLPLRSFGFSFIIQADFLTTSTREDVLSDLPWNISLLQGVEDAFLAAVELFLSQPDLALKNTWFRFLPKNITHPFFKSVEGNLIATLKSSYIFRSSDGKYRLPSEVLTVPSHFCDKDGRPLIAEHHLPRALHYLSSEYAVEKDKAHLTRLGVQPMTASDFLEGLKNMNFSMSSQSEPWHEAVCKALLHNVPRVGKWSSDLDPQIRQLRILPLCGGSWVSAASVEDVYFDSQVADIPQDLDFRLLAGVWRHSSPRRLLFEALGVKDADSKLVCQKIKEAHKGNRYPRDITTSLRHIRFMFNHRDECDVSLTGFMVMDESYNPLKATEVYMDFPGRLGGIELRDMLPISVPYLHSQYLDEETDSKNDKWLKWLRDELGVNIYPRLINGSLSPELKEVMNTVTTPELLGLLKHCWEYFLRNSISKPAIAQLSEVYALCANGRKCKLNAAYLGRMQLVAYPKLNFLPIDDPYDSGWDFLGQLGVTLQLNSTFFLRELIRLREENSRDGAAVQEIYKQLDARFNEDPKGIREAFEQKSLIFLPQHKTKGFARWLSLSDVCWGGPPSIVSKVALQNSYPGLKSFFRGKMDIPDAPARLLADELKDLVKRLVGKPLTKKMLGPLYRYLADISDVIRLASRTVSTTPEWLHDLCTKHIFPVHSPTEGLVLCMRDDPFYIPDKNEKYSAIFRDHVPLLLLSETQRSRMQPLLDSEAVKPYMWYLEHSIQLESTPNGPRMHEADVTKKYAERMQYIRRLVFHRHKTPPPPEVSTALAKLQGFHVYTVDSVNTTYHLDGIHITTTGNLAVDQSAAQFAIFVNRDCTPARRDLLICLQLAELLEVDMEGISSIMAQDPEILLEYVEAIGLPHIPSTVLDEDHAHMQDRLLEYPGLPESPATINSPQPKRPNNGGAISAEYFAYNVLKFLPQFGPKNWTSELRGEVKEFDGYQGKAVADFVYEDSEGALTNMLYGAERKQAWRNQWPTYHLKVKATPGQMGQQYVFEMSRDDIEAASRHSTYRSVGTVPREVYVIIRVYDAEGTAPSYRIYPDPLLLLRKGELRIVSDVGILPMEDDCAPRK